MSNEFPGGERGDGAIPMGAVAVSPEIRETFVMTARLRWRWVEKRVDEYTTQRLRVLEQAWQGSSGTINWLEVPEV